MEKEIFAKRLIELRKQKGYTQQQLADILKVTNKAISRWETGEGYPDITLLRPLSDALGVTCDELLSDKKNYTDIKRSDIQKYIPYIVAVGSLCVFYIFMKLSVPIILSFFTLLAGLGASCYLMIHHTDKKKFPNLLKFQMLLLYFPFVNLLTTGYMMYVIMKMTGFANSMYLFMSDGKVMNPESDGMESILGMMDAIFWIYFIGAVLLILLYFILKLIATLYFKIEWTTKKYNLDVIQKMKVTLKTIHLKPKREESSNMMKASKVLCLLIPSSIVLIMFLKYREYSVPALSESVGYSYHELYLKISDEFQMIQMLLYAVIGVSCIFPCYGIIKGEHKLKWVLHLGWFIVFCGGLVNMTVIEEFHFIQMPFTWLFVGILVGASYLIYSTFSKDNKSHEK